MSVDGEQRYRCEWRADGDQCRYLGTISGGTRGEGPWYCSGHALTHDQALGAALVRRSIADIPNGADYTARVLTDAARHSLPRYDLPSLPVEQGTPITVGK